MSNPQTLAIVAAVMTAAMMAPAGAEKTAPQITYSGALKPGMALTLEVSGDLGGDVHVIGSKGTRLEVSARPKGEYADRVGMTQFEGARLHDIQLFLGREASGLRTWLHLHDTQVEVIVRVPSSTNVTVKVVNGPVAVADVTGPLAVTVVNGPIDVKGAGAVLALHCTNGAIDVEITALNAVPNVVASTTTGAISIRVPKHFKAAVDAGVVMGSVDNNLPDSDGPGSMDVHVVTGAIDISYR